MGSHVLAAVGEAGCDPAEGFERIVLHYALSVWHAFAGIGRECRVDQDPAEEV